MQRQEMFDKALKGVLKQGGPAIGPYADCAYRNERGQRCAVGHIMKGLIPEDSRSWEIMGGIDDVLFILKEEMGSNHPLDLDEESLNLLDSLQQAHDTAASGNHWNNYNHDFVSAFCRNMADVARHHDLIFEDPNG